MRVGERAVLPQRLAGVADLIDQLKGLFPFEPEDRAVQERVEQANVVLQSHSVWHEFMVRGRQFVQSATGSELSASLPKPASRVALRLQESKRRHAPVQM